MTDTKDGAPAPDIPGPDGDEQTVAQIWDELDQADAEAAGNAPGDADAGQGDSDFSDDPSDEGNDGDTPPPDGQVSTPAAEGAPKPSVEELQAELQKLHHKYRSVLGRLKAKDKAPAFDRDKGMQHLQTLKQHAEDYPDILKPAVDVLETLVEAQAKAPSPEEVAAQEAAIFNERHPDFGAVMEKHRQDFTAWLSQQPQDVRDFVAANKDTWTDGDRAADLVDTFKAHLRAQTTTTTTASTLDQKRQRQRQGATGLTSRAPGDNSTGMDDWDYFEALDRAKGRR